MTIKGTIAKSAFVMCVHCVRELSLAGHEIDEHGCVTRDVECPLCHRLIRGLRLEGWPFSIDLT